MAECEIPVAVPRVTQLNVVPDISVQVELETY